MKTGTLTTRKPENKKSEMIPFANLRRDMNRLFDEFFHHEDPFFPKWQDMSGEYFARVDIKDHDNEIVVTAELPGVDLEDIDLTIYSDHLKIAGEKKEERENKEKGRYRMERSYGYFSRILPLPCDVERSKVNASYKDGILKIEMPKSKSALNNEHKISVKKG